MWKEKIEKILIGLRENIDQLSQRIAGFPMKWLHITAIGMFVVTVVLSVILSMQMAKLKQKKVFVPKMKEYQSNTKKFIFISQSKEIGGKTVELTKMLADSVATVFYFDQSLPVMEYDMVLEDEQGKVYNMDLSFLQTSYAPEKGAGMVLRFDPLDENITNLTLSLIQNRTGEKTAFSISLSDSPYLVPVKYIPNVIEKETKHGNISLMNGLFAPTGTILYYQFDWKGKQPIQHGWQGIPMQDLFTVKESGQKVNYAVARPLVYPFTEDHIQIARMNFEGIRNLNAPIQVDFCYLYAVEPMSEEMEVIPPTYVNNKRIKVGTYTLVLERMRLFDEKYVLVYHMEEDTKNSNMNTRVEARVDMDLIIGEKDGLQMTLEGRCRAKQEGGEVQFDVKEARKFFERLDYQNVRLNIKKAGIRIPDVEIPIALSELETNSQNAQWDELKTFIKHDFKQRLDVTNTQVLSMGMIENEKAYGIVQNMWQTMESGIETYYYSTHKVTVQNKSGIWEIIDDTVLK
jgi:hypothetical protein